jgi:hypothetical protein
MSNEIVMMIKLKLNNSSMVVAFAMIFYMNEEYYIE